MDSAFQVLRRLIGSSILLGLEILVAADLIRAIVTPSLEEAATLALIVAIRTVLSISIQIEIEGLLPWKRALLTNGGWMLAETVVHEAKGSDAPWGRFAREMWLADTGNQCGTDSRRASEGGAAHASWGSALAAAPWNAQFIASRVMFQNVKTTIARPVTSV